MSETTRPWNPTGPEGSANPFDVIVPVETDLHLTIDEIEGGHVRLLMAPWPGIDDDGRLVFPDPDPGSSDRLPDPTDQELILDGERFHRLVSGHREAHSQMAPDRPLRVGDVFWFRGEVQGAEADDAGLDGELIDVTFGARNEAKAAMAWAVSGSMHTSVDLMTAGAEMEADDSAVDELDEMDTADEFRAVAAENKPDQEPEAVPGDYEEIARPTMPGAVANPSI